LKRTQREHGGRVASHHISMRILLYSGKRRRRQDQRRSRNGRASGATRLSDTGRAVWRMIGVLAERERVRLLIGRIRWQRRLPELQRAGSWACHGHDGTTAVERRADTKEKKMIEDRRLRTPSEFTRTQAGATGLCAVNKAGARETNAFGFVGHATFRTNALSDRTSTDLHGSVKIWFDRQSRCLP
jgi:hypothetical protein